MTALPTIQSGPQSAPQSNRNLKRIAIHLVRILLFVVVIALIHWQHVKSSALKASQSLAPVELDQLKQFFPAASSISQVAGFNQSRDVFDATGNSLGYVLQTSPQSDRIVGFSGPTNTLVAFSADGRILGIDVLSSGDTRDHVRRVVESEAFLGSFDGLSSDEVGEMQEVDCVSGATLTSFAIAESVMARLGGGGGDRASLRFPDPLSVESAKRIFPNAAAVRHDVKYGALWHVRDATDELVGSILRTSPAADNTIGYQGPTDAIVGVGLDGEIVGVSIGKSYDNQPYVDYVREDEYFLSRWNGLNLATLASPDGQRPEVEGVSGATMTSTSVAGGILLAAAKHKQQIDRAVKNGKRQRWLLSWSWRDLGTAVVILCGVMIAFSSLRGSRVLRVGFQLILIGYLGLINGDLLSQAMVVGWAKSGVPWGNAGGLVLLTVAAFLIPMTTKRNAYCSHLCPHGAAQHLLMNRFPWRVKLPVKLTRWLKLVPAVLLVWCVVVAMTSLSFSLVDIEPFDAWVFRVAGWATITVAIVGLVASLFVPMAYCKFGCPTGAMLGFIRFNSKSDHWSGRDWFAVALVALALGLLRLLPGG